MKTKIPPKYRPSQVVGLIATILFLYSILLMPYSYRHTGESAAQQQQLSLGESQRLQAAESSILRSQINSLRSEVADLKNYKEQVEFEKNKKFRTNLVDTRPLTDKSVLKPNPSLALFDGKLTQEEEQALNFTSQYGEDRIILSTFFRNFHHGFFVELGAMDGSTISNTKMFQDFLGWKGVLIEPSNQYEKLRHNPRCLNGGATCLNMAICDSWRTAEFRTGGNHAVGGLEETMTEKHVEKFFKKRSSKRIKVPCGPMGDVLKLLGARRIDFFSIDVEGGEVFIVDSMDWINIPVHVVMIERSFESENTERIDRIMIQSGFKYFGKIGPKRTPSVVWVNPKHARHPAKNDSFS